MERVGKICQLSKWLQTVCSHVFRKTFFKGTLEKFLRIQLPCCIYLEGCPRVVLYNSNKIIVIRRVNQKICKETYKRPRKKVGLKPFGEVANFAEPPHFFRKTFFKGSLEKFLRIQQPCCMYLEGCSRVALCNGNKIMIIRLTNQKILQETGKKPRKKNLPCVAL